jgi:hypothetical protein
MALANDQTVTVGSDTIALARVFTGKAEGRFVSANGDTAIDISPTVSNGRSHRAVRFSQKKTTADPLVGSVNIRVNDYVSLNINRPQDGYTDADVLAQVKAFIGWLTAGTDANLKKIIAGEN